MSATTKTKKKSPKKPAAKKASKKPAKRRVLKKKNAAKSAKAADPAASKERRQAKEIGISLTQYRVLKAVVGAGKNGLTYAGIKDKTGYYSVLTAVLRTKHKGSLCSLKLTKEQIHDEDGKNKLYFVPTALGKAKIAKAAKVS